MCMSRSLLMCLLKIINFLEHGVITFQNNLVTKVEDLLHVANWLDSGEK